jgi:hypothetical protein
MGIVAILSFFLIMFSAVFIDGGFASSALGVFALLASLGIAGVGLTGLFNFIKHQELPDTFHPRPHDPHTV